MSQSNLEKEIFNAILKDALLEIESERLKMINEIVEKTPPFSPSKMFKRKMKQLSVQARAEYSHRNHRMVIRFISVLAAVLLMSTLFFVIAESNGINLIQFIFRERYAQVETIGNIKEQPSTQQIIGAGWNQFYVPGLIPSGYKIVETNTTEDRCDMILFDGKNEMRFVQRVISENTNVTVDIENANYHDVEINGYKGFFIEKNGMRMLYFQNSTFVFTLTTTALTESDLIGFLQNLKFIKIN